MKRKIETKFDGEISRLEIIDCDGRRFAIYADMKVSIQDNGKTLKIISDERLPL